MLLLTSAGFLANMAEAASRDDRYLHGLHGGVILQYHHVDNSTPAITSISVEKFEQHMQFLTQNNFLYGPLSAW